MKMDIVRARAICDHIPTFLESLHEIRMDVKLIILLGIIAVVGDNDGMEIVDEGSAGEFRSLVEF